MCSINLLSCPYYIYTVLHDAHKREKDSPSHQEPGGDVNQYVKSWVVLRYGKSEYRVGAEASLHVSPVSAVELLDKSQYPHP